MKFSRPDAQSTSESSVSPDVTAEVMGRLGFEGLDGSPQSIRQARRTHLIKRAVAFGAMFLIILTAATIERHLSRPAGAEVSDADTASRAQDVSRVNAISALQAPFQRINSSLSAAEELEAPSLEPGVDVEIEGAHPLHGPILIPGAFGDASASLTSS
jgi:hypothetical protein